MKVIAEFLMVHIDAIRLLFKVTTLTTFPVI